MPSMGFSWGVFPSCRAEESAPWPKCPRFLCPKAAIPISIMAFVLVFNIYIYIDVEYYKNMLYGNYIYLFIYFYLIYL